jgi:hypothetical protein
MRIETLTVTVTVEGDAGEGERAFARLFDKFSALREERLASKGERAATMARDRTLSPDGGRS